MRESKEDAYNMAGHLETSHCSLQTAYRLRAGCLELLRIPFYWCTDWLVRKKAKCTHAHVSSAIDFSKDIPTVVLLANISTCLDACDLNYVFPTTIKSKSFLLQNNGKKEHIFQALSINISKIFWMDVQLCLSLCI